MYHSSIFLSFKHLLIILFFSLLYVHAENTMGQGIVETKMGYKKYLDTEYQQHLWGPFPLKVLQEDNKYKIWYFENYDAVNWFHNPADASKLRAMFKNINVEIYMGTWCDDSKNVVPSFMKLWDEMQLDQRKIKFIGISSIQEKGRYKTTPNKIEIGKFISHSPTIIFKENNVEIGRIIEYPREGLKNDITAILNKKVYKPRYSGNLYLMNLLYNNLAKKIEKKKVVHLKYLKKNVASYNELDMLSLIYRYRGEKEKALLIANWNNELFPQIQKTQSRIKNTKSYFLKNKK